MVEPDISEEPPKKRAKCESEKSVKFWFDDGNIVLVANRRMSYRVHGSIMSRRSKVFSDLLRIPRPDVQDEVEGCPEVHVSDDHTDFETFLGLIYNGFEYRNRDNFPSWHAIKVMLALGDKYEVKEFRDEGVRHLEMVFPSDVMKWNKIRQEQHIRCATAEIITLVNAVRRLERPDLLASVLYQCSSLPSSQFAAGFTEKGSFTSLCNEDILRCIRVREDLTLEWLMQYESLFSVEPPKSVSCTSVNRTKCQQARNMMLRRTVPILLTDLRLVFPYDVLDDGPWEQVFRTAGGLGMCLRCRTYFRERCMNARQKLRGSLKVKFGL